MNKYWIFPLLVVLLAACEAPPPPAKESKPGAEKTIRVESTEALMRRISREIERTGTLRANSEVKLSVQQEGLLLTLPFHEGDRVKQGELLLQLDDTLLTAQLKKSRAQRLQAEQDLKRLKKLQGSRVVSEEELARAATALDVARAEEEELRIKLQQTRIDAPFDGIISERLAEPGDTLQRFSHVLTLLDIHALHTELKLSEVVIPELQVGDSVSLAIDALGPKRFSGTILRIHPQIDESTRQGTIEVLLEPVPEGALPGQLCRVKLQLRGAERLLVPYNALRRDTRGEFLYVIGKERRAERRGIVSGLHFGDFIEILDGLHQGEQVVTRGFLGLSAGSLVETTDRNPQP